MDRPVLSAKDASFLISKRSILPRTIYLSLKGCITAKSGKIRGHNGDFFLLEVDHCVFIIVKDFHLYWHKQIYPRETVVFYELRLTTIEKGISTLSYILASWRPSRIIKAPHNESIVCSTLEEWLSSMDLKDKLDITPETVEDGANEEGVRSFSGKVTSVSEADDGIYELNDSIRLVTWVHPSILDDSCLHLGCQVQVCNAHQVENSPTEGGKTLVCCTRTSLQFDMDPVIVSNMKAAQKVLRKQSSITSLEDLKSTVSKYGLNFKEVESLLRLRDSLKGRKRKEMTYILHYVAKRFCGGNSKDNSVSVLDMFLQHKEFCPFAFTRSLDCRIPELLTVANLQESNLVVDDGAANGQDSNPTEWNYRRKEWTTGVILLGSIISNIEGQMQFMDQSGQIPVILVHRSESDIFPGTSSSVYSSKNATDDDFLQKHVKPQSDMFHKCSSSCHKYLNPAEKLLCPLVSANIVGKMICVTKFHQVTELCTNSKDGSEALTYLIFSLQNCVLSEPVTNGAVLNTFNSDVVGRHNSRGLQNHQNYVMTSDNHQGCYIYVSEKQQRLYSCKDGNYFYINGRMLDPSLFAKKSTLDDIENLSLNQKENKHNFETIPKDSNSEQPKCSHSRDEIDVWKRKRGNSSSSSDDEGIKKKKDGDFERHKTLFPTEKQTSVILQEPLSHSLPVIMCLSKRNTRLFPLIHPGQFYLLMTSKTNSNGGNAFQPKFSNEKLGKALNKCGAKTSIDVPDCLEIKDASYTSSLETVKSRIDMEDKLVLVSFAQVLSEEFQDSLVSFTAMILRRETQRSFFFTSKDNGALSSFSNVRLDLCDVDSHLRSKGNGSVVTFSLYFNSMQMVYVLGLIPGSVVDVCCVERKVSKSNTVYCRFIAVSSIHVKSFLTLQISHGFEKSSSSNSYDFTQYSREYIATIWSHGPGACSNSRTTTWHIQCHICVIFSLKLELLCKKCSGLVLHTGCQSRGCDNASYDIVANSVILVEDGTCQAIVKLRKPHMVRKLLTLNGRQWDDVMSLLQTTGQLYISKQGGETSSNQLEMFLAGLISSSVVVRPIKMLVRVFKDSPCSKTVNKMKQKEFKLKDFRHGRFSYKMLHLPYLSLDCDDLEEMT